MTREEAINAITQFIENYAYGNDLIGLKMAIETLKKERPQGKWEGKPESKLLITRRCTACGERGVVGNFCWLCGSDNRKRGETE